MGLVRTRYLPFWVFFFLIFLFRIFSYFCAWYEILLMFLYYTISNHYKMPPLYIYIYLYILRTICTGRFRRKGQCFGELIASDMLRKIVIVNICRFLNRYWDWAVWIWLPLFVRYLFVVLVKERSLQKQGGYTRRTAGCHFGCCHPHKEAWRSTETKK